MGEVDGAVEEEDDDMEEEEDSSTAEAGAVAWKEGTSVAVQRANGWLVLPTNVRAGVFKDTCRKLTPLHPKRREGAVTVPCRTLTLTRAPCRQNTRLHSGEA